MSFSLSSTKRLDELPQSQRDALVKLLADEDPQVHEAVRAKILSYGRSVIPWLQQYALSPDPLLRRRSHEIVHYLGRQEADNRFLAFCLNQKQKPDLERGAWLLAQTEYPEINIEGYEALLDSYARDLMDRIDFGDHEEKILRVINQYLFQNLGYGGNQNEYYDPENSYLNRVVDRRTGNPISLSLIYLLLARRLQLPIVGIGMPGHFVCRYQSHRQEIFIDTFNQGRLLTRRDCVRYLNQAGYGFQESFLWPVSPRRVLLRICANLQRIYEGREWGEANARFQRYIVALAQ